jgi:hypothetical protein
MLDMIEQTAKKGREQIAEIEKVMNKMGPGNTKETAKSIFKKFAGDFVSQT